MGSYSSWILPHFLAYFGRNDNSSLHLLNPAGLQAPLLGTLQTPYPSILKTNLQGRFV